MFLAKPHHMKSLKSLTSDEAASHVLALHREPKDNNLPRVSTLDSHPGAVDAFGQAGSQWTRPPALSPAKTTLQTRFQSYVWERITQNEMETLPSCLASQNGIGMLESMARSYPPVSNNPYRKRRAEAAQLFSAISATAALSLDNGRINALQYYGEVIRDLKSAPRFLEGMLLTDFLLLVYEVCALPGPGIDPDLNRPPPPRQTHLAPGHFFFSESCR